MSSLRSDGDLLSFSGHGVLLPSDGGGRLECYPDDDVFSIGDASLDSSASIGSGPGPLVVIDEELVVVVVSAQ